MSKSIVNKKKTGYRGKFHWKQLWSAGRYKRYRNMNLSPISRKHLYPLMGSDTNKRQTIRYWKKNYNLVELAGGILDFWAKEPDCKELFETAFTVSYGNLGALD